MENVGFAQIIVIEKIVGAGSETYLHPGPSLYRECDAKLIFFHPVRRARTEAIACPVAAFTSAVRKSEHGGAW